jgi:hypothetical protein
VPLPERLQVAPLLTRALLLRTRALPPPIRALPLLIKVQRPIRVQLPIRTPLLRELRPRLPIKAQDSYRRRLHHCRCLAYWVSARSAWAFSPVAESSLTLRTQLSV